MSDLSQLKNVHIKDFEPISSDVLQALPPSLVRQRLIVPVSKIGGRLTAAVPKTDGIVKPQGLQMIAHCPVDLVLAPLDEIIDFIKAHYPEEKSTELNFNEKKSEEPTRETKKDPDSLSAAALAKLDSTPSLAMGKKFDFPRLGPAFSRILEEAVINRASELLIEHNENRVRIRQRIRGVLVTDLKSILSPPEMEEVFGLIKKNGENQSASNMKWAEWNFPAGIRGEIFHCSAVLSETKTFSALTVRLMSDKSKAFSPANWGMGPLQAKVFESLLQKPQGLLLFCGLESDDFLSFLGACVKELATPERHFISVQGAVTQDIPGVEQFHSQGDSAQFSRLLKLAFQHQPDLVFASPLEKKDDFDLCLRETLRGRLVISHVFARDGVEALVQIMSMGLEASLVGSSLLGVIAQRTLRLICPQCQEKDPIHRERAKEMGIPIAMQPPSFFRGKGCEACFKTGFDRETNIFEIVEMTDELRLRLHHDLRGDDVRSLLKSSGMMTLRQAAVHKAVNGQTSLAEVLRVTPV